MKFTTFPGRVDNSALPRLDTDFGHMPTGSLYGRAVQIDWTASSRAQASAAIHRFFSTVTRLAERVLNSVTPHSVRGHPKARAALEQTSREVGELLGALSDTHHEINATAARTFNLNRMTNSAQPGMTSAAPTIHSHTA